MYWDELRVQYYMYDLSTVATVPVRARTAGTRRPTRRRQGGVLRDAARGPSRVLRTPREASRMPPSRPSPTKYRARELIWQVPTEQDAEACRNILRQQAQVLVIAQQRYLKALGMVNLDDGSLRVYVLVNGEKRPLSWFHNQFGTCGHPAVESRGRLNAAKAHERRPMGALGAFLWGPILE